MVYGGDVAFLRAVSSLTLVIARLNLRLRKFCTKVVSFINLAEAVPNDARAAVCVRETRRAEIRVTSNKQQSLWWYGYGRGADSESMGMPVCGGIVQT